MQQKIECEKQVKELREVLDKERKRGKRADVQHVRLHPKTGLERKRRKTGLEEH
jgi:hypothetical protein